MDVLTHWVTRHRALPCLQMNLQIKKPSITPLLTRSCEAADWRSTTNTWQHVCVWVVQLMQKSQTGKTLLCWINIAFLHSQWCQSVHLGTSAHQIYTCIFLSTSYLKFTVTANKSFYKLPANNFMTLDILSPPLHLHATTAWLISASGNSSNSTSSVNCQLSYDGWKLSESY